MTGIMTVDEPLKLLIERARSGNREAFESLSRDVRGRLVAFVQSRLGPSLRGRLDPEDVVQETLLRAFETVKAFRGADIDDLWKWLASIAEHLIWNAIGVAAVILILLGVVGGLIISQQRQSYQLKLSSYGPSVLEAFTKMQFGRLTTRVGGSTRGIPQRYGGPGALPADSQLGCANPPDCQ